MNKRQTMIAALVLVLAAIAVFAMQYWVLASLFATAGLLFASAGLMQSRRPGVSARKKGNVSDTHVGGGGMSVRRSPEDVRRIREYRQQHPGATILEAAQAVEGQR